MVIHKKIGFCLLALVVSLCGSSKSTDGELSSFQFAVVDSLVQKPVVDTNLNISFRPPNHWVSTAGDTIMRSLKKIVAANASVMGNAFVYQDKKNHAYFILNAAPYFNAKNGDSTLQKISMQCKKQFPQCEIQTTRFIKDPFVVSQAIVNMGKIVLCCMFFNTLNCPTFQASFFLPFNTFSEQMKIVESVIGSVKPIHDTTR